MGKALPGIDADVVDETGGSVPPGQGGYLVIKKPWPGMLLGLEGDDAGYAATYWEKIPGMYFAGDVARRDHVRAIRAVTPDGGLQLLSGIEAGNILTVGRAMDMTRGFADALDGLPQRPLMVLGFDCILRRLALERAGMAGQMSRLLARYNVAGFNTYGEQHGGMHVNQTFVGMALMPPVAG